MTVLLNSQPESRGEASDKAQKHNWPIETGQKLEGHAVQMDNRHGENGGHLEIRRYFLTEPIARRKLPTVG